MIRFYVFLFLLLSACSRTELREGAGCPVFIQMNSPAKWNVNEDELKSVLASRGYRVVGKKEMGGLVLELGGLDSLCNIESRSITQCSLDIHWTGDTTPTRNWIPASYMEALGCPTHPEKGTRTKNDCDTYLMEKLAETPTCQVIDFD